MEAKQHASEQPTNHRINQNMHRNKWKWKHNNPKPMGHCKSSAKRKVQTIQAYLKKQEKSQINDLTLHLKQLENDKWRSSGLVEGKKS